MTNAPQPGSMPQVSPWSVGWRMASIGIMLPLYFRLVGGTWHWWAAWAYCALLLVPMTVFVAHMARTDPEFLARRLVMREKERTQRRIITIGTPVMLLILVLPGLDRRFGWSTVPNAVVAVGLLLSLLGYLGVLAVFMANRWAGRTVETRPGQQVIDTGPYAHVRHPMYVGVIVMYLGTPLALGSWWALLPSLLLVPILVVRIGNEEEVLLRELPGYAAYRARVRYRLVPGLW